MHQILLTFSWHSLQTKKLCKVIPVKTKAGFVSYWQQCPRKRELCLFSSIDKSQRSAKFSSFTLTVGKELQKRAQVSEGWSTYKTCVGETCSCSAGALCWAIILVAQHQAPAAPLSSTDPVLPVRAGDVPVLWQGSSCRHGLCLHHALQEWLPQDLLPFDPPSESVLARAAWHYACRQPLQNDLLFAWECHPHWSLSSWLILI